MPGPLCYHQKRPKPLKVDALAQTATNGAPRLAEAMAALSIATDYAKGQRRESAMGAALLACRMAKLLGLDEEARAETCYAALLRLLGCTSVSVEAGQVSMGQDQNGFYTFSMADWTDPEDLRRVAESYFLPSASTAERRATIDFVIEHLEALKASPGLYCGQAVFLASRLPVPERAVDLLHHIEARWDGALGDAPGEATPIEARILLLATHATLYFWVGGASTAAEFAQSRAGRQFDPALCDLLTRERDALFAGFADGSLLEPLLDEEPGDHRTIDGAAFDTLALTFGQFADQKTGWYAGHSGRVMALAAGAAGIAGLDAEERERLRNAALTHDIGRVAIPNGLLERADSLGPAEMLEYHQHPFHTEYILSRVPGFGSIARLASSAHERVDGSGYHRGSRGPDRAQAILAAANRYVELTTDQPWRDALVPDAAAALMIERTAQGRHLAEAVSVVLEAAGHRRRVAERAYPDGLTRREVDVLRCVVQGRTTQGIADRLGISPKTADHHIQHIYEKTGMRGRAPLALYGLKSDIFAE
jgi:DNA-binding CsgD family transcriptional regulator